MIAAAKLEDVIRIVDLGEMLHQESTYRDIPYSRQKVAALMTKLIAEDGVVFVSKKDGVVVGGIAGGVTPYWFSDELVGYEYSFFLEPGSRHGISALKLINAFKAWCKARGAKRLRMGITTGINADGTARFYRMAGFSDAGALFETEL